MTPPTILQPIPPSDAGHDDDAMSAPSSQPPRSHRLRIGRHSAEGGIYLLTFTTQLRQPLFNDFDRARIAARALADPSIWPDARLLAWVLMPDHWHGLLQLGSGEPLSRRVARAKAEGTRQWNRALGEDGTLWAPGFHDRALRSEDSIVNCARYIILNPVRAGLAHRCGNYPFWDAVWIAGADRD